MDAGKMPHLLNAGFSDTVARRLDTGHSSAYLGQQYQTSRNLWNPMITILIAVIHCGFYYSTDELNRRRCLLQEVACRDYSSYHLLPSYRQRTSCWVIIPPH